ncbi:MAG: hypothetical protein NW217_06835 [Hyphomicrobiaceae bacterium]|nr:hypothetical protein [Hyphomicrobiaceae bacterium]
MNKLITLIAATVAAATLIPAAPAEAGGGVRLNFGYPLGSFTATRHSPDAIGAGSYRLHRGATHAAHKALAAKRAAAARHAEASRTRAAKLEAAKAAKLEAAEQRRLAQARRQKSKTAVAESDDAGSATVAKSTPVKASALAGANPGLRDEETLAAADTTEAAAETSTETNGTDTENEQLAAATASVDVPPIPTASPEREVTCKRYIPSAGLTITVPCGEK